LDFGAASVLTADAEVSSAPAGVASTEQIQGEANQRSWHGAGARQNGKHPD